jgi:hypothetical protein
MVAEVRRWSGEKTLTAKARLVSKLAMQVVLCSWLGDGEAGCAKYVLSLDKDHKQLKKRS